MLDKKTNSMTPPTIEIQIGDIIAVHTTRLMEVIKYQYVEFVWFDGGNKCNSVVFIDFRGCEKPCQVADRIKAKAAEVLHCYALSLPVRCMFGKYDENGINIYEEV